MICRIISTGTSSMVAIATRCQLVGAKCICEGPLKTLFPLTTRDTPSVWVLVSVATWRKTAVGSMLTVCDKTEMDVDWIDWFRRKRAANVVSGARERRIQRQGSALNQRFVPL